MPSSPVVVELTPPGRGAVATLLVEGAAALQTVGRHFRPNGKLPLEGCQADRLVFGRFGSEPAEEVVVRLRSQQSVEVHCHGGHAAIERIRQLLATEGCRPLAWQAWTLERLTDPIASAACIALSRTRTERTAAILLEQYQGALRQAVDSVRQVLAQAEIATAKTRLAALLSRTAVGLHLVESWRIVLAGPPNSGKSTLINALAGYRCRSSIRQRAPPAMC